MRILITGPESSGKSTIASELSQELDVLIIPEFARTYLQENGPGYTLDSIITIAEEHQRIVNSHPKGSPLILDTYMYNLSIWAMDKYGQVPIVIQTALENLEPFDYIFLMYPDTPWIDDGLREDADRRVELFDSFITLLERYDAPYHIINGVGDSRLQNVLHYFSIA